jgi:hypothetical protein
MSGSGYSFNGNSTNSGASAALGFVTTTPLNNGGVYDSVLLVYSTGGYSQVQTEVNADTNGTMTFTFYDKPGKSDLGAGGGA